MATPNVISFPVAAKPQRPVLERFSDYLYAGKGLADSTVDLTLGFIRRMEPVLGLNPSVDDVHGYIANMRRAGGSYGNVSNAIAAVEHFMDFLGRPVKLQRPRRPQKGGVTVLSEAKVTLMIAACKTIRERAVISTLAFTGIRNREFVNLRIRDIDVPEHVINVEQGKGAKSRTCFVSGECMEIIAEYLRWRDGKPEDFAFLTARRPCHQLQTQDVRKLVRTIARRAGIDRRVWPHLFRHSLATNLLDRGAQITTIQAILGHAFISTTIDNYLHATRRTVQSECLRYMPSYL